MEGKWKVAFLCKNNTCRSQIAEALAKRLASDVMDVYSAGVELGKEMHDCAVRMLKETHGIDLVEEGYHTKLISDIPDVDIIIYIPKYMSGSADSDICLCIGIYGAFDYHWTYIWTVVFENFIFRKNR